jgi:predicted AAA+ superfamily ATPase
MYPFLPEELGKDFQLEDALAFGTLPVIWQSASKPDSLSAYVELYLKEEIQAEALVRNLPGFARFLPTAALFHGQTLNIASLARDAQVSRTTVQGYLEILEDTLMAFRLPAFEGGLRVREKRHPKWHWVDAGIVRALKKQFGPITQEERGTLFEGWIAGLLRSYQDARGLFDRWYYWSPAAAQKTEVDFLLESGGRYLALEVKSGSRVHGDDLKGLKAIQEFKKGIKRWFIYTGSEKMKTEEGIEILPVMEFVKRLENKTLWASP